LFKIQAQLRKIKYDSLIAEDFSKEEALRITIETKQWE